MGGRATWADLRARLRQDLEHIRGAANDATRAALEQDKHVRQPRPRRTWEDDVPTDLTFIQEVPLRLSDSRL